GRRLAARPQSLAADRTAAGRQAGADAGRAGREGFGKDAATQLRPTVRSAGPRPEGSRAYAEPVRRAVREERRRLHPGRTRPLRAGDRRLGRVGATGTARRYRTGTDY